MYHHTTKTNPKLSNWRLHPERNNKSNINGLQNIKGSPVATQKRNELVNDSSCLNESKDKQKTQDTNTHSKTKNDNHSRN